jgi:sugar/nucleoside kinase (ribokinase family)
MYDIITFGSATRDINLKSKSFKTVKDDKDFVTGEGLCLSLGSKIDIDEIKYSSGGGGTNVAATFAKQGLKTAYCGAIGVDSAGLEIIRELKPLGIDLKLLQKRKEKATNQSVIIATDGEDRTILAYRGAAELMDKNTIPWLKLKAKWFYLAPLSGLLCDTFEDIVNFAVEHNIKIVANPSKQQLSLPVDQLERLFSKIDILFLNQEEASFLTKVSYHDETEIFKKLDQMCHGVVVMTKGGEGVIVSDGKYLYSAKPNAERVIVDTTGAGDSFASGFVAEYIKTEGDIEKSIQLGMANSEANLKEVGAKTGLLEKDAEFKRVEVVKQLCSDNNLCITK